MRNGNIVYVILVMVIILLLISNIYLIFFYDSEGNINKSKGIEYKLDSNENDDTLKINEEEYNEEQKIVLKILSNITEKTNFTGIFKSTVGDVTAEKISKEEFESKIKEYITILTGDNEAYNVFEEDETKYVEYEEEKVLNKIGLSSHMGVGTDPYIQIINLSNNGKIAKRQVAVVVLKDILEKSDFNGIYKSTTGDISAPKMSKIEFSAAINDYSKAILVNSDLLKIYEENGKKYVEYETEKVLRELGLSSHMGVGIKRDIQKIEL